MEQINLIVPIIAGIGLFIVTEIFKLIPALKKWNVNSNIILYAITIPAVLLLAYFFEPTLSAKEIVDMGVMFAVSANVSHLTIKKGLLQKLLPFVLDLMTRKRGE